MNTRESRNASSKEDEFVRQAKEELKKLDARRKALLDFLSTYEDPKIEREQFIIIDKEAYQSSQSPLENEDSTIRERLISVVKVLVESNNGKSVRVPEIMKYIDDNKVDMGNAKNAYSLVTSILSQEVKKVNGKIRKIRRGMYNLR